MASLETSELLFGMLFFKMFSEFTGINYNSVYAPSTAAEGNPNEDWAGADLVIDDFCFQLKMAEEIHGNRRVRNHHFNGDTYFQFQVKNKPNRQNACQLDLLVEISRTLPQMKVFYASPCFGIPSMRNRGANFWFSNFANSGPDLINNFVSFFDIRSIPDTSIEQNNNHKIKYSRESVDNGFGYYFSEPKIIKCLNLKDYDKSKKNNLFSKNSWAQLEKTYQTVDSRINSIKKAFEESNSNDNINDMSPFDFISYLASEHNIFWLPLRAKHGDYRQYRINNDLNI
jgi:hypothetical protein